MENKLLYHIHEHVLVSKDHVTRAAEVLSIVNSPISSSGCKYLIVRYLDEDSAMDRYDCVPETSIVK